MFVVSSICRVRGSVAEMALRHCPGILLFINPVVTQIHGWNRPLESISTENGSASKSLALNLLHLLFVLANLSTQTRKVFKRV